MFPRLRIFAAKLKGLLSGREPDAEFDDEMQSHFDLLTERYLRQGMTPDDAVWAARRQFGNVTLIEENRREMQIFPSVERLWRNVRYAVRQLRRNPVFTTIAVLSLALGIGANTAVFTLLDQLVLRLLPVREPERLVMIWSTGPNLGGSQGPRRESYPMYQDFQRRAEAFESVFCRFFTAATVGVDGASERVNSELVSGNYFQALGVGPAVGRVFAPQSDDQVYKGHPVVVLSHYYWVNRFAADVNIVGTKILVNNYPMEVVGVSAPGFTGVDPSQVPHLWVPIQMKPAISPGTDDSLENRRSQWIQMFARLKPGYTVESARASLQPLFHQILQQELQEPRLSGASPYSRAAFLKRAAIVETAANGYSEMRQQYSTALIVLMGMAGLILLIACSNVASLLIARAAARKKEIGVRLALGAARRTLIGQLLVESTILSLAGAALGLLLSLAATRALLSMLPNDGSLVMLWAEPDLRILLFSIGVAVTTGMLFGLAPGLQGTKLDMIAALKDVAGGVAGGGKPARLRKALVTVQVALSFILLIGAGLFARTLANLQSADTGLRQIGNLITFGVDPVRSGYPIARISHFYAEALREVRAVPGVESAAYTKVPLLRGWASDYGMNVEGHQAKDGEDIQQHYNVVSSGYFRTMGIPLLAGRDFDDRDRFAPGDPTELPTVAIVNRKFAEHYFGARSPIGRRLGLGLGSDAKSGVPRPVNIRIIGMVENSLYASPRAGVQRQVFFTYQANAGSLPRTFYVRTTIDPKAMFPALRRAIARLDPSLAIYEMKALDQQLNETLNTNWLIASLSVVFGALATVLAALGLYGVLAFTVAQRTKEIGIRMALGARRQSVLWLIARELLILLGVGFAAGIPCAYIFSQYVSSQLFGVMPTDMWTWAAAVVTLGLVAAISGLVPARRVSTTDPLTALRYE